MLTKIEEEKLYAITDALVLGLISRFETDLAAHADEIEKLPGWATAGAMLNAAVMPLVFLYGHLKHPHTPKEFAKRITESFLEMQASSKRVKTKQPH